MRIFVASWFFPPMTSSEGIVAYKLFRNSRHQYDVCSSVSQQWSYKQELACNADNIQVFPVATDDFEPWIVECVRLFEQRHRQQPYDALMTRSMPPESIEVARRLRQIYPDLPWIASIADPIAKSPYEIDGWIFKSPFFSEKDKLRILGTLRDGVGSMGNSKLENIRIFVRNQQTEDYALDNATALIFPWESLRDYVVGSRQQDNTLVVPHSYDRGLLPGNSGQGTAEKTVEKGAAITAAAGASTTTAAATTAAPEATTTVAAPEAAATTAAHAAAPEAAEAAAKAGEAASEAADKVTLTFTGHTDALRSLEPLVKAMALLQKIDPATAARIAIRVVGNVPLDIRTHIFNNYLYRSFSIEPSVDYLTSLQLMAEADWLIHVDAYFGFLKEPGGSVFFAGKLADYMATDKPILAITGKAAPGHNIVSQAGGLCVTPDDIEGLAAGLARIAKGQQGAVANQEFRSRFNALNVAHEYDLQLESILGGSPGRAAAAAPAAEASPTAPAAQPATTAAPTAAATATTQPAEAAQNRSSSTNSTAKPPQPLITICVPTYNVEKYLDRCLYSLVSCEVAEQLEVLVINDESPDGSRDIALAYQERYPDIIRVIDKPNGGHGSTINKALEHAQGLYFRVLDGDDWLDSKALDELVNNMAEKDLYPDLVSTNYLQVYIDDGHTVPWLKTGDHPDYEVLDFGGRNFSGDYFTMASLMIRTEILRQAQFRLQEHTYYVDVEYILYPIPLVKTVMFTPEYLYRYAVGNIEQSISQDNFVKRYDHHDRVIRRMLGYYEEHKPRMAEGPAGYMKSLFKNHFLQSHYLLSLLWDPDKRRGAERAQDFDNFLKATDSELYDACGGLYRAVRQARAAGFSPDLIQRLRTMDGGTLSASFKGQVKALVKRAVRTNAGRRLARLAASIIMPRISRNGRLESLARRLLG